MSDFYLNDIYKNAYTHYKIGNIWQAKSIVEPTLTIEHKNYDIFYLRGCICLKEKSFDEAKGLFLKCLEIDKKQIRAYFRLMSLYGSLGYYLDAERMSAEAERLDPMNTDFLKFKASLEVNQRNFEEAAKCFDKLMSHPKVKEQDKLNYCLSKARCLISLKQLTEAKEHIESVEKKVNIGGGDPKLMKKLFDLQIHLKKEEGNLQAALEMTQSYGFRAAFGEDYYYQLYLQISIQYELQNYDQILEMTKDVENMVKNDDKTKFSDYIWNILFYIASAYRNKNRFNEFINIMQLLEENGKQDKEDFYLEYARYYLQMQDDDKCLQYIGKSLKKKPNYIPAIKFQIAYYNNHGRKDKADEIFNKNKAMLEKYDLTAFGVAPSVDTISIAMNSISISMDSRPLPRPDANINAPSVQPIPNLIVENKEYRFIRKIGAGGFGEVSEEIVEGKRCACKKLLFNNTVSEEIIIQKKKDFKNEIYNMLRLNHPNVISLEGFFGDKLMMEFAEGGDLSDFIKTHASGSKKMKTHFCIGIAEGLKYIHEQGIVHGDMKPQNILLDKKFDPLNKEEYPNPKICDFGLSAALNKNDASAIAAGCSPHFTAPEVYKDFQMSKASDVFSFGLIMYNIFSGFTPYYYINDYMTLQAKVKEGELPNFTGELTPSVCPPEVKSLIENCCKVNKDERFTMDNIVKELKNIYPSIQD